MNLQEYDESEMVIVIDTREKVPFFYSNIDNPRFPGLKIKYDTLKSGDYSLVGMSSPDCEHSIAVERKSLIDLFSSVGRGRERLIAEFKRMQEFDYAALVIEGDYREMLRNPPAASSMNPKSVFRSILAFSVRYNLHIFACPNRVFAERLTYLLLKRFWDDRAGPERGK